MRVSALWRLVLVALLGAFASLALALARPPGEPASSGRLAVGDKGFELDIEDQHGNRVTYPLPEERLDPDGSAPVVLVVWADRRGADARRGWADALRERYAAHLDRTVLPSLVVLPVAHLPNVPGPIRALIRKRTFGDRRPTGLDWQKRTAAQLGFEPGVPNLALFAPDGTLTARLSGEPTEANRRALFAALDRLLQPSEPDPL